MVIFRFLLRTGTAHVLALIYMPIYKLPVRNIVLEFEVKSTFLPLGLSVT